MRYSDGGFGLLHKVRTVARQTVMIYDGQCGLCMASMRLVRRLDWFGKIEYLDARRWDVIAARYPQLAREAVLGLIHVVRQDGQIEMGYAGVRALVRDLPVLMWLYPLLYLPGITWLGPRVYGWVAANRLRLNWLLGAPAPCDDGVCSVHAPPQSSDG